MRLQGLSTIVTGGASGFGAEIARSYAREGAKVVILDLNADGAKKVAAEIGDSAIALGGSVTSKADVDASVKLAVEKFGKLDVVVNNAGWTFRNKPLLEVTEEEFDKAFDINVKSIFLMTNACVPVMKKQKSGRIINIGSTAGVRPRPGLTWYNATKGAVNLMSKSMAVELAPDGIRVNCIAPVIGEPRYWNPSWACRIRQRTAPNSSGRSRSAACHAPRISPMPACIWRARNPSSSPA
jgi:3-oxoacyl-[acyl-carrier protein] reductase